MPCWLIQASARRDPHWSSQNRPKQEWFQIKRSGLSFGLSQRLQTKILLPRSSQRLKQALNRLQPFRIGPLTSDTPRAWLRIVRPSTLVYSRAQHSSASKSGWNFVSLCISWRSWSEYSCCEWPGSGWRRPSDWETSVFSSGWREGLHITRK